MLTDERISKIAGPWAWENLNTTERRNEFARAVEAEATAPLLARIAELEKELATVKDGYDIMGLAEEQRQKPGPFSGRFTPNAAMKEQP